MKMRKDRRKRERHAAAQRERRRQKHASAGAHTSGRREGRAAAAPATQPRTLTSTAQVGEKRGRAASAALPTADELYASANWYGGGRQSYFAPLLAAADSGHVRAMRDVGRCYERALGCRKDTAKAAQYYSGAAAAGCAESMLFLAHLYYKGDGVEKNARTALRWITQSAAAGHAPARDPCLRREIFVAASEEAHVSARAGTVDIARSATGVPPPPPPSAAARAGIAADTSSAPAAASARSDAYSSASPALLLAASAGGMSAGAAETGTHAAPETQRRTFSWSECITDRGKLLRSGRRVHY